MQESQASERGAVEGKDIGDRELVGAYLERRDERAFMRLHRRHTPYLMGMGWRLTGGPAEAVEDLVESTWTRALPRLGQFEWKSTLRTWLAGILINCQREMYRSSRGHLSLEQAPEAVQRPEPLELRIDLERALAQLAHGFREVVVLYHVYGYRHADIAGMLGITEATSRSQLARGLQRLRTLLK